MKTILTILLLVAAHIAFAQTRTKDYKLHPSLKVSAIFSTDTVLLFKFHSLKPFDIKSGDKMILATMKDSIVLICDKPTSYHVQHTASNTYYNGAYFKVSAEQYIILAHLDVRNIIINSLEFAIKNNDGIKKALNN